MCVCVLARTFPVCIHACMYVLHIVKQQSGFVFGRSSDEISIHRAAILRFSVIFLCKSREMFGQDLKLGYHLFLDYAFQFIIH
jgi:hypothetical protein